MTDGETVRMTAEQVARAAELAAELGADGLVFSGTLRAKGQDV